MHSITKLACLVVASVLLLTGSGAVPAVAQPAVTQPAVAFPAAVSSAVLPPAAVPSSAGPMAGALPVLRPIDLAFRNPSPQMIYTHKSAR